MPDNTEIVSETSSVDDVHYERYNPEQKEHDGNKPDQKVIQQQAKSKVVHSDSLYFQYKFLLFRCSVHFQETIQTSEVILLFPRGRCTAPLSLQKIQVGVPTDKRMFSQFPTLISDNQITVHIVLSITNTTA
jgi:hypothetical protein